MITLYGKDSAISRITSFKSSGRFPHAILLTGEAGVGKRVVADYIARLYVCGGGKNEPCNACIPCEKALSGHHPDIVFARDLCDEGKYKVGNLRQITAGGSVRPNDGDVRVYIFEGLDEMSEQCQNTLLKFIEEPLDFNRFVFTASSVSGVLQTIVSRVVSLPIEPPKREDCVAALLENGLSRDKAEKLAEAFGGNIGRCLSGADDEKEQLLRGTVSEISSALSARNEYRLAAAFSKITSRDDIKKALLLLSENVCGALAKVSGAESEYKNAAADELSRALGAKKLLRLSEALSEFISKSDFNPNVPLAVTMYACELYKITAI